MIQPKEKITLRYPFLVPYQGDIELRLCRIFYGYPLVTTTLTVDKEPHYYDIELTDYKVVYKADEEDMTEAVKCTLSLKNNDERTLSCEIYSRIGNDGRENVEYDTNYSYDFCLFPGQSNDIELDLDEDLEDIQEPTDLHLVVKMFHTAKCFVKLLDIVVKPGTVVTSKGTTTAVGTIDTSDAGAPDDHAPFYDLQGRRVSHPQKGVYIRNGKTVVVQPSQVK